MTEPRRGRARRIAATVCLVALALLVAGLAWSLTSLHGLPDIGDPFDVAAFTSDRVRDEDNAFVLYRKADALYRDWDGQPTFTWRTASDAERKWLEDNREALDVWRRGTEKPDACFIPPGELTFDADLDVVQRFRMMVRLACLEASRLEAQGDFQGAWAWYRAALRASRHCGRRGSLIERLIGMAIQGRLASLITTWAGSPKVDARMLRKALAEVQEIDAMSAPVSVALKCEYLSFLEALGRPEVLWKYMDEEARRANSTSGTARIFARRALLQAQSVLRRDPERSRRLMRLIVANWLVYCDRPFDQRPPLEPGSKLVYRADSSVPPAARLLSPEQMDSWFETTIFVRMLLPALDATRKAFDRERNARTGLILAIANELYEREHGEPPDSPEQLVSPYLKELPPGAIPK